MKLFCKRSRALRRSVMLGLATCAMTSGCASMQHSNWFGKKTETTAMNGGTTGFGAMADTGKGITGQFKTMGTAVGSAVSKTKNAVTSVFSSDPALQDPTSLANMPTNLGPEIWVTNGQLYESQGNFAKAHENYNQALSIQPNNEAALLSIARLHVRQQQYKRAEEHFARAQAVKPSAAILNEIAQVQQKQSKLNEALATVNQAIRMEPENVSYRNNLAGMLVASGRSDEAVKQLEQVFPPAVANYNVAYMHFSGQNAAAAQHHLQIALQQDPNLKPARELMDRLTGSSTAKSAMAAYQTAGQVYRTAEALTTPSVQANSAIYQQPPATVSPAATSAQ